jgi:hypothetical protein
MARPALPRTKGKAGKRAAFLDEREEAKRETAARAPELTGRRKDGVLKSKARALEAQGSAPHKTQAARTRAATKLLAAAGGSTSPAAKAPGRDPRPAAEPGQGDPSARSVGAALAKAAATRRARKGAASPARGKKA